MGVGHRRGANAVRSPPLHHDLAHRFLEGGLVPALQRSVVPAWLGAKSVRVWLVVRVKSGSPPKDIGAHAVSNVTICDTTSREGWCKPYLNFYLPRAANRRQTQLWQVGTVVAPITPPLPPRISKQSQQPICDENSRAGPTSRSASRKS